MGQAVANLLDNAAKYTPQGGAVMLRTRRRGSGEIEISVTDTGPGIPEEDRARVVERFVRLERSRNAPGLGLGLALVSAVAAAHGGRLELDEGPGEVGNSGPGLRTALVLPAAS
jgi:signal transduction histidine kinase